MTKSDNLVIDQSVITAAINYLQKGELVAFPTETVYGLGADASNEVALQKLYSTKGRPADHPVIVHLARAEQMQDWAEELSDYAKILAKRFWPGPLTLIVKKAKFVSSLVTGGQDTVGLRVPAHPVALALLDAFAGGIAAPSANKYGRVSSTCAQHVHEEFGNEISLVVDGGSCVVGIESTIVDTTDSVPRILRPGIILEKDIFDCLELKLHSDLTVSSYRPSRETIRVPGSDKTHYAPRTPVFLLEKESLQSMLAQAKGQESYAVLAFTKPDLGTYNKVRPVVKEFIQAPSDPQTYAHDLYSNLRQLDESGASHILIESIPDSVAWIPILDRLRRAATNF